MERDGAWCVCVRAFRSAAVVHDHSRAQTRARSRKASADSIPLLSFPRSYCWQCEVARLDGRVCRRFLAPSTTSVRRLGSRPDSSESNPSSSLSKCCPPSLPTAASLLGRSAYGPYSLLVFSVSPSSLPLLGIVRVQRRAGAHSATRAFVSNRLDSGPPHSPSRALTATRALDALQSAHPSHPRGFVYAKG